MPSHSHSIWIDEKRRDEYPSLESDHQCDVAVIGGGITGITLAYLLVKKGYDVAVVEADRIGTGTTGHTSAHLSTFWDGGYVRLIDEHGQQKAKAIAEAMQKAITRIDDLIQNEGINCSFKYLPGFFYACSQEDSDVVGKAHESCRKLGLPVELGTSAPLPFPTGQTMKIARQARFDPIAYLKGLAQSLKQAGGKIFENSRVTDYKNGKTCELNTEAGKISCSKIVMATHLPLGLNPIQAACPPYRSYVAAFKFDGPIDDALYWDTSSPYFFTRCVEKNGDCYLIVGGCDHKTGHGSERESAENLKQYIKKNYGEQELVKEWSAQFYEPVDGIPFVGESPLEANVYIATGYSGDGLTMGTAAAEILSCLLSEQNIANPFELTLKRINFRSIKQFAKETLDVGKCMIVDRLSADSSSLDSLSNNRGMVMREKGKQIAVYRDSNGKLTKKSAVCPHMKCVVHWNSKEQTFDCPCHGSRFSPLGKIVNGPAMRDLSEIE